MTTRPYPAPVEGGLKLVDTQQPERPDRATVNALEEMLLDLVGVANRHLGRLPEDNCWHEALREVRHSCTSSLRRIGSRGLYSVREDQFDR